MSTTLYRLEVKCHACGEQMHTFISADVDLDAGAGRQLINDMCDKHSAVCAVRNEP